MEFEKKNKDICSWNKGEGSGAIIKHKCIIKKDKKAKICHSKKKKKKKKRDKTERKIKNNQTKDIPNFDYFIR